MKKAIFIAMAGAILLAGCSSSSAGVSAAASSPASIENSAAAESTAASTSASVDVDQHLLSTEVTISKEFFDAMNSLSNDDEKETPEEYCEEMKQHDGIKDAVVNADGSVTLTMTKKTYQEFLDSMKSSVDETISQNESEGTFPSVKEVTYSDDLSEFDIAVDAEKYKNSFDGFIAYSFAFQGYYYQLFLGNNDPHIVVKFTDEATGEELDNITFPDVLEDSSTN